MVYNCYMQETTFLKSIKFVIFFYFLLLLVLFLLTGVFSINDSNLQISLCILFFGNFFIAILTQVLHLLSKNYDHFFKSFRDCFPRSLSGFLEMVFYAVFFSIGLYEIIVGYLILKVISVWKSSDQYQEGLSTSVLRTALVLSLLLSFWAAYNLNIFLEHKYDLNRTFPITKHRLFPL